MRSGAGVFLEGYFCHLEETNGGGQKNWRVGKENLKLPPTNSSFFFLTRPQEFKPFFNLFCIVIKLLTVDLLATALRCGVAFLLPLCN